MDFSLIRSVYLVFNGNSMKYACKTQCKNAEGHKVIRSPSLLISTLFNYEFATSIDNANNKTHQIRPRPVSSKWFYWGFALYIFKRKSTIFIKFVFHSDNVPCSCVCCLCVIQDI